MTEALLGAAGVLIWGWLIWQGIKPDSLLFEGRQRKCTGCQRYFIRPGCPVHDPQSRRTP